MPSQSSADAAFFEAVAELLAPNASPPEPASDPPPVNATNSKYLGDLGQVIRRSKETRRLRLYRQRVRNERDYLQRQEKLLSAKLTRLKEGASSPVGPRGKMNNVGISTSVWRVIATQQYEARKKAEDEQLELKASIKTQDACIGALQELLRCRYENKKD